MEAIQRRDDEISKLKSQILKKHYKLRSLKQRVAMQDDRRYSEDSFADPPEYADDRGIRDEDYDDYDY
jgi:hypothetical protein